MFHHDAVSLAPVKSYKDIMKNVLHVKNILNKTKTKKKKNILQVNQNDIPDHLKVSKLYFNIIEERDEGGDDIFFISEWNFKLNTIINDDVDFFHLIETCRYWDVHLFPQSIVNYVQENSYLHYIDNSYEFSQDLKNIKKYMEQLLQPDGPAGLYSVGRSVNNFPRDSIAIGFDAGINQGNDSVAIGKHSGKNQGDKCVSIGHRSGENQEDECISIGSFTGTTIKQAKNSTIINSTGYDVTPDSHGFFVAPIFEREGQGDQGDQEDDYDLVYNPVTSNINYVDRKYLSGKGTIHKNVTITIPYEGNFIVTVSPIFSPNEGYIFPLLAVSECKNKQFTVYCPFDIKYEFNWVAIKN